MITTYNFEKIDNNNNVKYSGEYTSDGLNFTTYPYFTTIVTTYNNGAYSDAYKTMWDIYDVLYDVGIKVDLIVEGKETANLILPLVGIDTSYAYFSGNTLRLKVDSNGSVTEYSDVT
jgi:hypothetical protein